MTANALWQKSISFESLMAGWHLTRSELRSGFFFDLFHLQAVAANLHYHIVEIERQLRTNNYRFRPLRQVRLPKGELATRPGSYLPIRDRIVFWSIIKNVAPIFDKNLIDGVYSYRLKSTPKKGELFKECDALQIPFLKKKFIADALDPFEPWYGAWPDFEDRTKEIIGLGYNFLVVSDIAGYFENINIDIIKDQLLSSLTNEPVLSNFIVDGFNGLSNTTQFGSKPRRSIPQGSGVSSFFGNIYLMPIDEEFEIFRKENDIIYIRYMDDIRIFTKDIKVARKAIFTLEKSVRDLHLNLQSSKTKILQETNSDKQITNELFDDRIDRLMVIRDRIEKGKITETSAKTILKNIARSIPINKNSKKLLAVKDPKSALTDRAMRMWMNTCLSVGSRDYISTILNQIYTNPDTRLSRIYVNTCRSYPRTASLGEEALKFLNSGSNIHFYQEPEIIRAIRYLSVIPDELWKRCLNYIIKPHDEFVIRVQSLLLLGMRPHNNATIERVHKALLADLDIITHPYYLSVLGQADNEYRERTIEFYRNNANQHNHEFGILLDNLNRKFDHSKKLIDFIFGQDWTIADFQGFIFFMARSENTKTREYLAKAIRGRLREGGRMLLIKRLAAARNIVTDKL